MRGRAREVAAKGARLCFVSTGTPAQARLFAADHLRDEPVLCDPGGQAFAGAGMQKGAARTLRWSTLTGMWRAFRGDFRQGRVQGDPWQQGGLVVLDEQGVVVARQVDGGPGELLDLDRALAALAG